jgi:cytidylate kinase
MSVITISRQLGSLGTEIAHAVANELNYEYIDKEKIGKALRDYGLSAFEVETFDEKPPPFWDYMYMQKKKFLHTIQALIHGFARTDNVVIVGRGGQALLKDFPGVLHVRIFAPLDTRIQRILDQGGGDKRQTLGLLRRSDRDSAGFMRGFFDVDWDDPSLYDLMMNTRLLSAETVGRMIMESAHSLEIKGGGRRNREKLEDLALVRSVETSLLVVLGSDLRQIRITAEKGIVSLQGTVSSNILKEDCRNAVSCIKGVKIVNNQLSVAEDYGYIKP